MATYSAIGKWLLALTAVGAGTAGTVIGVSISKKVKEETTKNYLSNKEIGEGDSVKSSESMPEENKQIEERAISINQEKSTTENLGKIVEEEDLSSQNNYSAESQGEKGELVDAPQENPTTKEDQVILDPEIQLPPLNAKGQSPTKIVNWFSIELGELDFLYENSWTIKECQKVINEDQAVFKCLWDWEHKKSPTTINFYLFSSTHSDLSDKKWDDVTELSLNPDGEEKATLGLTFAGNGEQEIELSLVKK